MSWPGVQVTMIVSYSCSQRHELFELLAVLVRVTDLFLYSCPVTGSRKSTSVVRTEHWALHAAP